MDEEYMQSSVLYKPSFKKLLIGLGPGVFIYGFMVVVPMVYAFITSLYVDKNFTFKFAGFKNYFDLVQDPEFWHSLENNLTLIAINAVLQIGLAFVIALVINGRFVRAKKIVRIFIFFPVILTPIVVALLWTLIYNIDMGLLNTVLRGIGLGAYTQNWLGNPKIVIYSVIAPMTWQYLGLFVVIFMAGLTSVPEELLEQAEMDGANEFQKTLYVIMPLMANTWRVILVLSTANGIKVFEQPFAMTRGGPGVASSMLAIFAYNQSFMRSKVAYASAIAIVMVIITLVLIGVITFLFNLTFVKQRGK